jgi:hypothetical protein
MIYKVTAFSFNPQRPEVVSPPRVEDIDTETNELFFGATGPWDVEDRYEAFWNRLNDSWETAFPGYKEKVKVVSVEAQS